MFINNVVSLDGGVSFIQCDMFILRNKDIDWDGTASILQVIAICRGTLLTVI